MTLLFAAVAHSRFWHNATGTDLLKLWSVLGVLRTSMDESGEDHAGYWGG